MPSPEQIDLSFDWRGLTLAGSLHVPGGPEPHPAVVMAQGSGPADRESGGYFPAIRRTFIERGMATFAFDKPGCGESTGDWYDYGLDDRADQLVAALDVVRTHPAIAEERVGIWGHSQGGWLVQKLAGCIDGLAFAVASSAPSISVRDQILYDCEQAIEAQGYDDVQVAGALALTQALLDAAAAEESFDSVSDRLLTPATSEPWFRDFPTIEGPRDWHHSTLLASEPHEPLADLSRARCPFLAVYGGLDALLPPWQGARESGQALASAETDDVTVTVFPLGDHRIQDPATNEFVAGYLTLLGSWTASRVHSSE